MQFKRSSKALAKSRKLKLNSICCVEKVSQHKFMWNMRNFGPKRSNKKRTCTFQNDCQLTRNNFRKQMSESYGWWLPFIFKCLSFGSIIATANVNYKFRFFISFNFGVGGWPVWLSIVYKYSLYWIQFFSVGCTLFQYCLGASHSSNSHWSHSLFWSK